MKLGLTSPKSIRQLWISTILFIFLPVTMISLGFHYYAVYFFSMFLVLLVTNVFAYKQIKKQDIGIVTQVLEHDIFMQQNLNSAVKFFRPTMFLMYFMTVVSITLGYDVYAFILILFLIGMYGLYAYLDVQAIKHYISEVAACIQHLPSASKVDIERLSKDIFRLHISLVPFEIVTLILIMFGQTSFVQIALAGTFYAYAISTYVINRMKEVSTAHIKQLSK